VIGAQDEPGRTAVYGDRFAMHQNKTAQIALPLAVYQLFYEIIKYYIITLY
jgi:hypothetical protein